VAVAYVRPSDLATTQCRVAKQLNRGSLFVLFPGICRAVVSLFRYLAKQDARVFPASLVASFRFFICLSLSTILCFF
jgi:hypothetical protein